MDLLLAAGANASEAILKVVSYRDCASLRKLIWPLNGVRNISLYRISARDDRSYFGHCLQSYNTRNETPVTFRKRHEILIMLVSAMADARRQFMAMAQANIPSEALRSLGWKDPSNTQTLLDGTAVVSVAETLRNLGIKVPARLDPGSGKSVYHESFLTAQAAELLLSYRFTEIDLLNDWGCTPLQLVAHYLVAQIQEEARDIIFWFLDHGARTDSSNSRAITILHLMAESLNQEMLYDSPLFRKTWPPMCCGRLGIFLFPKQFVIDDGIQGLELS